MDGTLTYTTRQAKVIDSLREQLNDSNASLTWFAGTLTAEDLALQVPVQLVLGRSRLGHDETYIEATDNPNVGVVLKPGRQLERFFKLVNMRPRDVLTQSTLWMNPVPPELVAGGEVTRLNREAVDLLKSYLDMVGDDFKLNGKRESLLSPDECERLMHSAVDGGYPSLMGTVTINDIVKIDFGKPVRLEGQYGVGFHVLDGKGTSMYLPVEDDEPLTVNLDRLEIYIPAIDNKTRVSASIAEAQFTMTQ